MKEGLRDIRDDPLPLHAAGQKNCVLRVGKVRLTGFLPIGESWNASCYEGLLEFLAFPGHNSERIETSNRDSEQKERENDLADQHSNV